MLRWLSNLFRGDPTAKTRAEIESKRLALERRMLEAQEGWLDSMVPLYEPFTDDPEFWYPVGREGVPPNVDSRKRGEALPHYITEYGLKILRDQSRWLVAYNEFAIGATDNLKNFTCGKGLQYKAVVKEKYQKYRWAARIAARTNNVLKQFQSANKWGLRERESVGRAHRDGEAFLRLFHTGNGRTQVRFVQPEHVRSPSSYGVKNWFGIHNSGDDVEDITAYWVVEQPAEAWVPVLVPAEEIVHIKLNVDMDAKRGLPTWVPVRKNLERASNILRNGSILVAVQSTYAVLRKHKQRSKQAIDAFQQQQKDWSFQDPLTAQSRDYQRRRPGSMVDHDDYMEYEFPHVQFNAEGIVGILQAELRAAAARLNMPEFMFSSDASNANYSSTMIAESPSVRNFESQQALFSGCFGDGAYEHPRQCGLMWRVVRNAVEYGNLDPRALQVLDIQVEGPSLVVRDKGQESNRYKLLNEAKIMSKATWSKHEGLDREQEKIQLEEEEAEEGPPDEGQDGPGGDDKDGDPFGPDNLGESFLLEGQVPDLDEAAPLIADILYHLFGKKSLEHLQSVKEAWEANDHPRGKGGRFIPRGSAEAVAAAKDVVDQVLKGKGGNPEEVTNHLAILTVKQLRELHKANGVRTIPKGILREHLIQAVKDKLGPTQPDKKGDSDGDGQGRGEGSGGNAAKASGDGREVAPADSGPGDKAGDRGGADGSKPAGKRSAGHVPASKEEVNKRLDRVGKVFRSKGNHQAADWMDKLREHINAVGTDEALKALGDEVSGEGENVQYAGWSDIGDFATHYLDYNGISLVHGNEMDPSKKVISTVAPSSDNEGTKSRGRDTDVFPSLQTLKNKLHEAQNLPGLEKSEDLGKLMGGSLGSKVPRLDDKVVAKLNETYGEGKWIVKSYGDEAYAGYGIFFPQRAAQIRQDAQNTMWTAGEHLGKYGFRLGRDPNGNVQGIIHESGDIYHFGTPEYNDTINGDARHWADKAAAAAASEQGASIPEGSFMAQPAFPVVGVSNEERARGVTFKKGQEGRVHISTKDGKASVVPHSTWLKEEHLPVVFESEDTLAMAKAAVDAINALPESERKGQLYAPDIVKTADGYKVVEANPANEAGASGYLQDNPLIIDSYVSHLTGREPAHVKFVRKLLSKKKRTTEGLTAQSLEGCVPNKSGHGYHDDKTGHPCKGREKTKGPGRRSGSSKGKGGSSPSSPVKNGGNPGGGRSSAPEPTTPQAKRAATIKRNAGRQRALVGNENEVKLADSLGEGFERLPDSEAMDVVHKQGDLEHGIEVKTFLTNRTGQISMSKAQRERKQAWQQGKLIGIVDPTPRDDPAFPGERRVHVVVIDHRAAYAAAKAGKGSFADRTLDRLYYARGARAWNVADMIGVSSSADLHKLAMLDDDQFAEVYQSHKGKLWRAQE